LLELLGYTTDWSPEGATYEVQLRYTQAVDFGQLTACMVKGLGRAGLARVEWNWAGSGYLFLW